MCPVCHLPASPVNKLVLQQTGKPDREATVYQCENCTVDLQDEDSGDTISPHRTFCLDADGELVAEFSMLD